MSPAKRINIILDSEEQFEDLRQRAEEANTSLSEFLRTRAERGDLPAVLEGMIRALADMMDVSENDLMRYITVQWLADRAARIQAREGWFPRSHWGDDIGAADRENALLLQDVQGMAAAMDRIDWQIGYDTLVRQKIMNHETADFWNLFCAYVARPSDLDPEEVAWVEARLRQYKDSAIIREVLQARPDIAEKIAQPVETPPAPEPVAQCDPNRPAGKPKIRFVRGTKDPS